MASCICLEICPFLLGCPTRWHVTIHIFLRFFFVSLWYQLLYFSSLFGSSSWWAWIKFYQFYIFKKPAFGLTDVFYHFFGFCFTYFLYFLLSANFGLCSFLIPLDCRLGCLLKKKFFFWRWYLYCCKLQ